MDHKDGTHVQQSHCYYIPDILPCSNNELAQHCRFIWFMCFSKVYIKCNLCVNVTIGPDLEPLLLIRTLKQTLFQKSCDSCVLFRLKSGWSPWRSSRMYVTLSRIIQDVPSSWVTPPTSSALAFVRLSVTLQSTRWYMSAPTASDQKKSLAKI